MLKLHVVHGGHLRVEIILYFPAGEVALGRSLITSPQGMERNAGLDLVF